MFSTIWKFELPNESVGSLVMPRGAKLLSVGEQRGAMVLWAAVDPKAETVIRKVQVIGTGWPNQEIPPIFVGTVLLAAGALVFHVFDLGETVA
jgi:hypothetical protein